MLLWLVVSPTVLLVDAELGEDVLRPTVLVDELVDCPTVELLLLDWLELDELDCELVDRFTVELLELDELDELHSPTAPMIDRHSAAPVWWP